MQVFVRECQSPAASCRIDMACSGISRNHMLLLTTCRHLQALAERDVAFENIMEHPERELAALVQTLGLADKVRPCMTVAFSAGSKHWRSQEIQMLMWLTIELSEQELLRMSTLAADPARGAAVPSCASCAVCG